MKKIACGAIIAFIGAIYSIALMALATANGVHGNGGDGLWGLLLGYHAVLPLLLSLGVVIIGTALCVWGAFEKKK